MTCSKCQGLVVASHILEMVDGQYLPALRCLNCGNLEDETILKNRMATQTSARWSDGRANHRSFSHEIQAVRVRK